MSNLFPIATTSTLGVVQAGTNISITIDGIISTANEGTGFTGSSGAAGFTGSRGSVGFTGSQGTSGEEGNTGFTGSKGYTGSTGFTGSKGYTGSTGFTGSFGYTGSTGYIGSASTVIGFTGSFGYTGSIGTGGGATIGTWTPTIAVATAGTITLTTATASYAKMGQQVICYFDITMATKTGGANGNTLSLNGLPFTSTTGTGIVGSMLVTIFANLANNQSYVTGTVAGSSTSVLLYTIHNATDNSRLTYAEVQAGANPTRLVGTITYLSAS